MVYLACDECGCTVIQGLVRPNSQCPRCEGGRDPEVMIEVFFLDGAMGSDGSHESP